MGFEGRVSNLVYILSRSLKGMHAKFGPESVNLVIEAYKEQTAYILAVPVAPPAWKSGFVCMFLMVLPPTPPPRVLHYSY